MSSQHLAANEKKELVWQKKNSCGCGYARKNWYRKEGSEPLWPMSLFTVGLRVVGSWLKPKR